MSLFTIITTERLSLHSSINAQLIFITFFLLLASSPNRSIRWLCAELHLLTVSVRGVLESVQAFKRPSQHPEAFFPPCCDFLVCCSVTSDFLGQGLWVTLSLSSLSLTTYVVVAQTLRTFSSP